MTARDRVQSRGRTWFDALAEQRLDSTDRPATVQVGDGLLAGEPARFIAVVPDSANRFPRARAGEVGLEEAWSLAAIVRATIAADKDAGRRLIVPIVDVTSQAYGRLEEVLGLHLASAAAADAYASARLAGHPVIALIVGKAMSGAFLAHGYQANLLLAFDDPGVQVHAMGRNAAARITRRSVEELDALAEQCPPMAYDIRSYARWGLVHQFIGGIRADDPKASDISRVRVLLARAATHARNSTRDLGSRLSSPDDRTGRWASVEVRRLLAEQWHAL